MISRKLLKTEIDKVQAEYLELLYRIIQVLENRAPRERASPRAEAEATEVGPGLDWREFVAATYGCLADAPLVRPEQGRYESREAMR